MQKVRPHSTGESSTSVEARGDSLNGEEPGSVLILVNSCYSSSSILVSVSMHFEVQRFWELVMLFCAQKTQQVQSWIDVYSSHELIFWEGVENKDAAMHHQHSTVHPTLYMH